MYEEVPSTIHQHLKFPTHYGVGVITRNQIKAKEFYYISADLVKGHVVEATKMVILDDDNPKRTTQIVSSLETNLK